MTGVSPSPAPSLPLKGIRGFATGFYTPWVGFRFMQQHPKLWRDAILPVLCNLILTVLLIAGMAWAGVATYEKLESLTSGWLQSVLPTEGWWSWLLGVVGFVARFLIVIVIIGLVGALALGAWILFQGIFCGYFYSELARKVELLVGMKPEDIREVPLWYQVYDAVLDVTVLAIVAAGCFVLSFVPLIGAVAALVIGGYFNCFIFGMDYLDYPQALRARKRDVQRVFARRHRAATLGLGASVTLLSFIPILSSVLLTTAAAGAVVLYRRLEAEDGGSMR